MSIWLVAALVLMIVGLGPALLLATRRGRVQRLIGLQLAASVSVMILLALSLASGQSSYLIVPLTLAVLSVTGTLVFTRLLALDGRGGGRRGRG